MAWNGSCAEIAVSMSHAIPYAFVGSWPMAKLAPIEA